MSSCGRSRRLCWFNKRPTLLSCCFLSFLLPVPLFPQAVRLSHFLQGQWHRMQSKPCTSLRPWRYSTVSFALSLFSLCKWLRMVKPCSPGSDQTHDNHRFKFFTSSLYLSFWSFIFLNHLKEHNKAAVWYPNTALNPVFSGIQEKIKMLWIPLLSHTQNISDN